MAQADFAYAPTEDTHFAALAVSVFADGELKRAEIRADAMAAGLQIRECGPLAALSDGDVRALGDVVLADCAVPDAATLAALARLDIRAARSGAQLVISTVIDALDDVFACCDQSGPQLLVNPGRADRMIALGRVLALLPDRRVRELGEEDRLMLLRLTEQVSQLAQRIEGLAGDPSINGDGHCLERLECPSSSYRGEGGAPQDRQPRAARVPLPDPRLVRRIIRQRQLRARFFDGELFADPAWDMLLDLTAARAEHIRVSVTSLCIASGVPPTTALRWIGQMTDAGLLQRVEDEMDRRRAFITLTDRAADGMARYFAEIGRAAAEQV